MRRVINSFYTGKGEVGGETVFPAECSAHTRTTPGQRCSEDGGKEEQMRWQRQAGRVRTGKRKHAGKTGQIREFGLYLAGNGEPMKALN